MTITLEHVPETVSNALEQRARQEGKSVADLATEILSASVVNSAPAPTRVGDLSDIAGTMSEEDARAIEENVQWMDAADLAARQ